LAQGKVIWRNVTLFGARLATLAQGKVALRQRTVLRSTPRSGCAKEASVAPKKDPLEQEGWIRRNAPFLGAASPSLAQGGQTA
jgi:hypothetical protein